MTPIDTSTAAVEAMADKVLKAAGSSLSHYTLHKTREAILEAVRDVRRAAFEEAAKVAEAEAERIGGDYRAAAGALVTAKAIRALASQINAQEVKP